MLSFKSFYWKMSTVRFFAMNFTFQQWDETFLLIRKHMLTCFFLNRLIRSCSFINSIWQSYFCADKISELLWYLFLWFLSLQEVKSWSFHSFRHCIAVFISSLKQIYDVSLLLKMKHFLNVMIICFFSEFDQNVFISEKSAEAFFLWFIWIFFYDVCCNDFSFVSNENNNSI